MGVIKWTYETCYEEAKKYNSRKKFQTSNGGAYYAARKNGWLDDYTWFEKPFRWTYETCYEEAKKYNSRWEFCENCVGAYTAALKNGWINDYEWFSKSKTGKKWTREACYKEAKKYHSKTEFRKESPIASQIATKKGWLDDYTWLDESKKKNGYWNYERCYEEAKKYKTRSEFIKNANGAYNAARENNWLDDYTWFISGFDLMSDRNTIWTYERCLEEAKKCKSRGHFKLEFPSAYASARLNNWLDDYTWFEVIHMPKEYRFNLLKEFIDEYELRAFLENNDENILYIILRNVEPKYEPLVDEVEKIIRNSNGNDPMKALIDKYSQDETAEDVNKDNETSNETHEEIHGINDVDLDDDEAVKEALKQEEEKKEVSIDDVVKNTEKELEVINKIEHLLTPEDREYIMDKFLNDKLREYMAKKDAQK